jgi:hypothetical protein
MQVLFDDDVITCASTDFIIIIEFCNYSYYYYLDEVGKFEHNCAMSFNNG